MSPPIGFPTDRTLEAGRAVDPHIPIVRTVTDLISGLRSWMEDRLRIVDSQLGEIRALLGTHRKEHFTVDEFADLVGRSAYTVRRWSSSGKIHTIRLAHGGPKGRLLIPRTELEKVVAAAVGSDVPDTAM